MSVTFNTLSPTAQSTETGVIFPKAATLTAADFDKDLSQAAPGIFVANELFGAFMVVNGTIQTWDVEVLLKNGISTTITVPAWAWIPLIGEQILSAGTTATLITVVGGQ